ncbi:MAG: histidinol dehydrogenase [Oscillospiraceae bacterium]|nr:histidinol dehydrogenase [Oscillospiraceae bacterium]
MMKIYRYGQVPLSELLIRSVDKSGVTAAVREILEDVERRGDEALWEYTRRFDKAEIDALEVTAGELDAALAGLDGDFRRVLERAADNIRAFHRRELEQLGGFRMELPGGGYLGMKVTPMEKVGLCIPGRTAAYPSTVLMTAIPARLAGCRELVMVSPPGPDGKQPAAILAAARIAGVDRVFRLGGAQGVAALAFGTQSVPKVDKIVGPGSAYVAEAKRQVYGRVDIDSIAGPSEILVVADGMSDPVFVAADLLSQAEHDVLSAAVLITDSPALAEAVQREVERQLAALPRESIARPSIENNGKIILTEDLLTAVEAANALAPEHLELCVEDPAPFLERVTNAGSVFLGRYCPEALGDYLAGPNHTLPTGGGARFSSPLGVYDFVKRTQYSFYTADELADVSADIARFALQEGLEGHARSALVRFDKGVIP